MIRLQTPTGSCTIRLEIVERGQGQPILWLDAMKMEHTTSAPTSGVVTELNVTVGAQVAVGALLAVVTEPDAHTAEGDQA